MAWKRRQLDLCREFREEARKDDDGTGPSLFDAIPLNVEGIRLTLRAKERCTDMSFGGVMIKQGTFVALVGRSGQGKSSLLRLLGGAVMPNMDCIKDGKLC